MRQSSVLFCTPLIVAAVVVGGTATASAGPPSVADKVSVTVGANTTGIDAHLANAAAIQGTVKSAATGHGVNGATVAAYRNGHYVQSGYTDASGKYTIKGLLAGTYQVCVSGQSVYSGAPATGFLGSCVGGVEFDNYAVPSAASKITLSNGQLKTGKNITLKTGAAITGKVTSPSGAAVSFVSVYAYNRSNGRTLYGYTQTNGTYTIKSLPGAAKGYTVCFNPGFGQSQGATGFLPRCYKNAAWTAGSIYPSTATKVSVSLGHTHAGVSSSLPAAGAISGRITDAGNGKPIPSLGVEILSSSGKFVGYATTNSQGNYTAKGLGAASGDRVCAYPNSISQTTQYNGKCWKNVAWNGRSLPKGTTGVSVNLGKIHTGISLKLSKTTIKVGSIAGTITEAAGGQPLQNAEVDVYTAGGSFAGGATTASDGAYSIDGLRANSTGYVVCAKASTSTFSTTPTPDPGGWAARCYQTAAWNGANVPAGATKVPLSAGQHKTGVNIALLVGGEISGSLFVGGGPATASGVQVYLFTTGGKEIDVNYGYGTYSFTGLAPQFQYVVCFDGRYDSSAQGHRPQCYNQKSWDGTF
jgi:hypothetical protein